MTRIFTLAIAVAFLAGVVGILVRARQDDPPVGGLPSLLRPVLRRRAEAEGARRGAGSTRVGPSDTTRGVQRFTHARPCAPGAADARAFAADGG